LAPEFKARYAGKDDGQFLDAVYQNVFGRAADPGGRAYWLGMISSIGRSGVMVGFANSDEYVAATHTMPVGG
jgi:hypothetical protein